MERGKKYFLYFFFVKNFLVEFLRAFIFTNQIYCSQLSMNVIMDVNTYHRPDNKQVIQQHVLSLRTEEKEILT